MACTEQRREQIAALASGRSDSASAASLLEHLGTCPACSEEFDLVADLVAAEPHAPASAGGRWGGVLLAAAAVLALLWLWRPWAAPRYADLAEITPIAVPVAVLRGPDEARGEEYARALEAYRAGEYERAAGLLARVGGRRPDDALAHLYLGIARLQTGEAAAAAAALRVAAGEGTGLVRERGLWYLASAWLLLERPGPARAALQELAAEGGDYAVNARALLRALQAR